MSDRLRQTICCVVVVLLATMATSASVADERRCVCRYAGAYYNEGDCVCMSTSAGNRLACCGHVLNNASWSFVSDSCHVSQRPLTEIPVQTAMPRPFAREKAVPSPK